MGNRGHRLQGPVYVFLGVEGSEAEADRPLWVGAGRLMEQRRAMRARPSGHVEIPVQDCAHIFRYDTTSLASSRLLSDPSAQMPNL
jgi:hypothetical protein